LASIIFFVEVLGMLEREILDQPAVSEGTVSYECDIELSSGGDQTVVFMEGFERGKFRLDGIDLSDYEVVSLFLNRSK
jgi:hypothetical protein